MGSNTSFRRERFETGYMGNPFLKKPFAKMQFTEYQVTEFSKCATDLFYFVNNYVYIEIPGTGIKSIKEVGLWPCQIQMLTNLRDNKFNCWKIPRQSSKTSINAIYYAWKGLFNESEKIGIAANTGTLACEIVDKFKLIIEHLPLFLQQGILEYNKGNITLENGSEIRASATTKTAFRGFSLSKLLLDEFAFVDKNIAEKFYESIYPTISRAVNGQLNITSTPKGINNLFYKIWSESIAGKNDYVPLSFSWDEVPRNDQEKFKAQTIRNIGETKWRQEYLCEFLAESDALIKPDALESIVHMDPIESDKDYKIFKEPIVDETVDGTIKYGHQYVACVDSGEGVGADYSTFTITDVTEEPAEVVCSYRNNEISVNDYAKEVVKFAKKYNNSYLLIENNSVGYAVSETIIQEHDYDNIIFIRTEKGIEKISAGGFTKKSGNCLKMTKKTKALGCSALKYLIEEGQLQINDFQIFQELTSFVKSGGSYAASAGAHDDMVMTLVMFGWLTKQEYFKEITNKALLGTVIDWDSNNDEDSLPFGMSGDDLMTDEEEIDFIAYLQNKRTDNFAK